ncbi:MAG: hypothetical protein WEE64_00890 [Dehalococcoidia bacterium]
MRLTKAQKLFAAALFAPVSLTFVWGIVSAFAARPSDEPAVQAGDAISFSIFLLGPPTLVTLALFASKPASDVWKQARQNVLVALALLWSLVGITIGCRLMFEPELAAASTAVLFLPLGIWTFVEAYRNEHGQLSTGFLLHNAVAAAIMILLGAVLIALVVAFQAMGSTMLSRLLSLVFPTFLIALLACIPLNAALRWSARRRGEREVRLAPGFYLPLNRWKQLSGDDAEAEWRKADHVPAGGALTGAWSHKDAPLMKLECTDTEGRRWLLYPHAPTTPWPQWIAGPFVRASRNGDRGLRFRVFENIDCAWVPYSPESDDADRHAALRDRPSTGWVCSDCAMLRFDFTGIDGTYCVAYTNLPDEPEPAWYAGLFVIWARAPAAPPASEPAVAVS